jgi:hypothetical protein
MPFVENIPMQKLLGVSSSPKSAVNCVSHMRRHCDLGKISYLASQLRMMILSQPMFPL